MAGYRVYVRTDADDDGDDGEEEDERHLQLCVLPRPDGWYLWRAQCPSAWRGAELARVPTSRATEAELRSARRGSDPVLLCGEWRQSVLCVVHTFFALTARVSVSLVVRAGMALARALEAAAGQETGKAATRLRVALGVRAWPGA